MKLSLDQNKVFDSYDQLFLSEGWKMFIEDMRQNQESIFPSLMHSAVKIEDVYFLKGRNDVYSYILGLQSKMEQLKKYIEESDE